MHRKTVAHPDIAEYGIAGLHCSVVGDKLRDVLLEMNPRSKQQRNRKNGYANAVQQKSAASEKIIEEKEKFGHAAAK
jgi:hypothetical protein